MKRLLKPLLMGVNQIRQWVAVGVQPPQQQVKIYLHGFNRSDLDIISNCVVAALRPLTLAIGFPTQIFPAKSDSDTVYLSIVETVLSNQALGRIQLHLVHKIPGKDGTICLFEIAGQANYCLSPLRIQLFYAWQWWRERHRQPQSSFNFVMSAKDLRALYIFYCCARPVVVVSTAHEGANNLFPMDLIGPIDSAYFLMALRLTSPAVELMKQSRRIAMAGAPAKYKSIVYDLGKHHKLARINVDQLPFATVPSPVWQLPVPQAALFVREVEVLETHEVGSHMLFMTKIVHEEAHEEAWNQGLQMHHIPGLYQEYLNQQQRPLSEI